MEKYSDCLQTLQSEKRKFANIGMRNENPQSPQGAKSLSTENDRKRTDKSALEKLFVGF